MLVNFDRGTSYIMNIHWVDNTRSYIQLFRCHWYLASLTSDRDIRVFNTNHILLFFAGFEEEHKSILNIYR